MHAVSLSPYLAHMVAAQAESPLKYMGSHFEPGGSRVTVTGVVVFCGVVALLGAVLWCVARCMARREGRGFNSPRRLFRDLCGLHGLDWSSRWLLWRLARGYRLTHPAELFLTPNYFDESRLPTALRHQASHLALLRARLFGEFPTEGDQILVAEKRESGELTRSIGQA